MDRPKLLIVDDDPEVRIVVAEFLEGFHVILCDYGSGSPTLPTPYSHGWYKLSKIECVVANYYACRMLTFAVYKLLHGRTPFVEACVGSHSLPNYVVLAVFSK